MWQISRNSDPTNTGCGSIDLRPVWQGVSSHDSKRKSTRTDDSRDRGRVVQQRVDKGLKGSCGVGSTITNQHQIESFALLLLLMLFPSDRVSSSVEGSELQWYQIQETQHRLPK